MPTPPTQRKVNPADAPIMNIALSSTTLPLSTVDEYAENLLAQQISTVSGVAQVSVYGSQQYAVRIQLDPERARDARHRAHRRRAGGRQQQRQPADRHAVRPRPRDVGPGDRPADERRGVRAADRRLPQRRAGAPERDRARLRQRAERQDRRLVQRHARHHARRAAPAGHQHDRDRRRDPQDPADLRGAAAAGDQASTSSTTARSRSARRCTTSSNRCCSRWPSSSP